MSEKQTTTKVGFGTRVKLVFKRFAKFFVDVKSELKKVVWPTRKQVTKNTSIVLVVVVIMGLLLFGFDTIMKLLLDLALMGG